MILIMKEIILINKSYVNSWLREKLEKMLHLLLDKL
jgi:hypothetical protein